MKNTFVLRMNYADIIEELSDEQAGQVFKAIFIYVTTYQAPILEDSTARMALRFIIKDIEYDINKYLHTCARRAESGRLGGLKTQENIRRNQAT